MTLLARAERHEDFARWRESAVAVAAQGLGTAYAMREAMRYLHVAGLVFLLGCGGSTAVDFDGTGTTTPTAGDGLPCDVAKMLQDHCVACHTTPLAGNAPMPLLSYEDLTRASLSDAKLSNAEMSVLRMQDAARPMPPTGEVVGAAATLQAWLDAGAPRGDCADVPTDPPPQVCSSNRFWTEGDEGSRLMHPGGACISCHQAASDGPNLLIAGTVYPTLHELGDCNGTSGITVEVTDALNRVYTFESNGAGNFFFEADEGVTLATPVTALVRANGQERRMMDAVDSGDCNSCHTGDGANGAPGRILAP